MNQINKKAGYDISYIVSYPAFLLDCINRTFTK